MHNALGPPIVLRDCQRLVMHSSNINDLLFRAQSPTWRLERH